MNTWTPNATNTNVSSLSGNHLTIANALGIMATAGVFELGTLNVVNAGGAGDITLWSGDYISSSDVQINLTTPQVLAQVPEPGTVLLLGVGIGALGVLIRRSRQS